MNAVEFTPFNSVWFIFISIPKKAFVIRPSKSKLNTIMKVYYPYVVMAIAFIYEVIHIK